MAEALTIAPDGRTHNALNCCPNCSADVVERLPIADMSPGEQYYRCGRCGFVWGTREKYDVEFLGA
jgi:transposase-like protein